MAKEVGFFLKTSGLLVPWDVRKILFWCMTRSIMKNIILLWQGPSPQTRLEFCSLKQYCLGNEVYCLEKKPTSFLSAHAWLSSYRVREIKLVTLSPLSLSKPLKPRKIAIKEDGTMPLETTTWPFSALWGFILSLTVYNCQLKTFRHENVYFSVIPLFWLTNLLN